MSCLPSVVKFYSHGFVTSLHTQVRTDISNYGKRQTIQESSFPNYYCGCLPHQAQCQYELKKS
ncbi:hypothetical protein O3G_MSEX008142 [Manduca sexta]|uniref:Uncharacterized protein n=1 Tax=Manduca sexta TaxID=7130 RepID=A0A921Z8Q4_MANSE|nr:hypothetical protein O3G_MSEX008142 [Manduca sexta]